MKTFREEVGKILEQVLMKHHDDISKQDDDAIGEATDQILQAVEEILPKKENFDNAPSEADNHEASFWAEGFNSCLAQIREKINE